MRLLHVSDFLLGNANYRRKVRDWNGADLIDLDRRASFDRAVGCAIEHDVDVLLVAGGLVDAKSGRLDEYRAWLNERFGQLRRARVEPIIYDPTAQLDGLDACVLRPGDTMRHDGVSFAPITDETAEQLAARADQGTPHVALDWGSVRRGADASFETLDRARMIEVSRASTYVALGGSLECGALTPNALYCGAACGLFAFHPGDPGGVIVQIGRATQRVLDLIHVRWPCRRRVSVTIDAGGMDAWTLSCALHELLVEVCTSVDEHEPLEVDHPLAQLYGAPCGPNGVGWWSRPIVELKVTHAGCLPGAVWSSNPMLTQLLTKGEHLMVSFKWRDEAGAQMQIAPFIPNRRGG